MHLIKKSEEVMKEVKNDWCQRTK